MKLNTRIYLFILEFSLLPLIFLSYILYSNNKVLLNQTALEKIDSIAQVQKNRLNDVLNQKIDLLSLFTTRSQLRKLLLDYNLKPSSLIQESIKEIIFEAKDSSVNIQDIYIIDKKGIKIASTEDVFVVANVSAEDYFKSGSKENNVSILRKNDEGNTVQYLTGPLVQNGETQGVVVLITDAKEIIGLANDYTGLGQTGETLLAKNDGSGNALFITPTRFDRNAVLTKIIPKERHDIPSVHAVNGEENTFNNLVDYREVPVFSATRYLDSVGWGIVVKIDKSEALMTVNKLKQLFFFLILGISILIIILTIPISRAIAVIQDEVNKTKDEFISILSHQLKTPITTISWGLESLLDKRKQCFNKMQKDIIEKIIDSNKSMLSLVNGFLDITKMEAGQYVVEKGRVDLREISDSVLEELAPQITSKNIHVVKRYGQENLVLNIGPRTSKIILQNLITNAIKYTPVNGLVEVSIGQISSGILLAVKDNGLGIPDEAKGQIFTKLYRAENAKAVEPAGTGLGLYLIKTLVDLIRGRVWFESEEGKGSVFYVFLPGDQ